jgi:Zinc finger, C3HC4 type (RING finger)
VKERIGKRVYQIYGNSSYAEMSSSDDERDLTEMEATVARKEVDVVAPHESGGSATSRILSTRRHGEGHYWDELRAIEMDEQLKRNSRRRNAAIRAAETRSAEIRPIVWLPPVGAADGTANVTSPGNQRRMEAGLLISQLAALEYQIGGEQSAALAAAVSDLTRRLDALLDAILESEPEPDLTRDDTVTTVALSERLENRRRERALRAGTPAVPAPAVPAPVVPVLPEIAIPEPLPKAPPVKEVAAEDSLCVVCMDARRDHIILECAHLACCGECVRTMQRCPICREPITRAVRIYQS